MTIVLALVASLATADVGAANAAAADAGAGPQVELYTMGQGELLFERFGHAALCVVYDRAPERTRCYNYGTTDFESPPATLGWKFMRGTSKFWVSVWRLDRMIEHYRDKDRTIWVQRLPLSPEQVRAVADKLAFDALEQNRYYLYHHFKDNCTTRVRDIIDTVTDGALSRDSDGHLDVTFRELGRRGLAEMTGIVVIAHFMLGRVADRRPTRYEAMFLPDYLRAAVTDRLGVEPEVIYLRKGRSFPTEGSSGKLWLLLIAVVVALPTVATRLLGRGERIGLGVSAALLTLIGALIWFIAFISFMPELRWNEAALVFWPSDFLLVAFGPVRRRAYARVRVLSLLIISVALAVGIFCQPLLVPLLIPLAPFATVLVRRRSR